MKKDFRYVTITPLDYVGPCHCKRCGKSFSSQDLVLGRPNKAVNKFDSRWYCPTEDCLGYIHNGVVFCKVPR